MAELFQRVRVRPFGVILIPSSRLLGSRWASRKQHHHHTTSGPRLQALQPSSNHVNALKLWLKFVWLALDNAVAWRTYSNPMAGIKKTVSETIKGYLES
ncbi:hypothetical protein [Ferrimonas balearica]|uniref:hypothetical protein n=1 Tax=Ferrimonas balearica TaxID=44012 RepID=UPI001C96A5C8|nr:hypothetical protein [Ferrimonas balearica]MBY5979393.1 hypothetical protein [Ferrimonas balearica]